MTITDPCLSPIDYTIHTSSDSSSFRYELGKEELVFWVWFESKLDEDIGVNNFCGPITGSLQANSSTASFLTETFDSANNTFKI